MFTARSIWSSRINAQWFQPETMILPWMLGKDILPIDQEPYRLCGHPAYEWSFANPG